MIIKVNNKGFNSKQHDLIFNPKFSKVLEFLISTNGKATLREIKRNLSDLEITDEYIDQLVVNNLIDRHHGKYSVEGKVITSQLQEELNEKALTVFSDYEIDIRELLRDVTSNEDYFKMLYLLSNVTQSDEVFYYENSLLSEMWLRLPTKIATNSGKKNTFLSLGSYAPDYNQQISDYFNYLKRDQINLPPDFIELRDRLGDINPSYFIFYCERKLRRLSKGKFISIEKEDIFMDALLSMKYVDTDNQHYSFNMLEILNPSEDIKFAKIFNCLNPILTEVDVETTEESSMIRMSLISWLIKNDLLKIPHTLHAWD